jgi:formylglycine-generating enzyme required for sulfatase activity
LQRAAALLVVLCAIGVAVALARARRSDDVHRCGPGFIQRGPRCETRPSGAEVECPPPLEATGHGCDAPDVNVLVPASVVAVGPSDWEAEGRVPSRSIRVQAFRIDAFEVTGGHMGAGGPDAARAASSLTRAEAQAYCASRGGRLPTEDEWIVAAASAVNQPRRYPWGDTGAVCRRAAWGLATGPCAVGAEGPDTVGSHPDGDSPLGLHDLAGNVAEWVGDPGTSDAAAPGVAKGGSWRDSLATELRIWARLELPPGSRDPRVGARCAYPP